MKKYQLILAALFLGINISQADTISAMLYSTDKYQSNNAIGRITFIDTSYGLLIKPELNSLAPGLHGLHLHQHANCGDTGNHAGGHFDPNNTNSYQGPYEEGHLGDLPALYVDNEGYANLVTLAPRLHVNDLKQLAIMIHAKGDNYTDTPPLGGGGARVACGILGIK